MNFFIWVCFTLVAWPSTFAMYHLGSKEVFKPPTTLRNDSYFGYSITYDQMNRKLVISAPRADEYGQVYDCTIDNRTCIAIPRKIVENRPEKYNHDYWFGATVKSGPNFVMMCAPRYTVHIKHFNSIEAQGQCYSHKDGELTETRVIDWNERIADTRSTMEATMDSFGWSIDVASTDAVIVGGPGMFHGRVMVYQQYQRQPKLILKNVHTPDFDFGYAVAAGAFLTGDLSYAVGSPYGYGDVSFYRKENFVRKVIKPADTATVVGSMFGAVLCAAQLKISKRSDLLVGAPTYATKDEYNLGAVYVYLALKNIVPEYKRMIVGKVSGAMFGSAIVSVGDLNGDKIHEIAIGAPFENGRGAVYLYSGADLASDQTEKWLQKIEPETSYSESFGMSLTPLLDYDGKGCNELAIGSPFKDSVVLLKCMVAVVVKTTAKFPNLQGRTSSGKTDFAFDVCLSVQYPTLLKKVTGHLRTTVEMIHDNAKLIDTNHTGRISFVTSLADMQLEYCKKVPFHLPMAGKYETEIHYTITSELLENPNTLPEFDSSRVVLSDNSVLMLPGSLWAAECAGKTCVPNLILTYPISFRKGYIIGSSDYETMLIHVDNKGEVAYDACVRVRIDSVNVLESGGCVYESKDGHRLKCEPSRPLRQDEEWATGEIKLEMTHLTNLNNAVNINIDLYIRCEQNVTQTIPISIPVEADPSGITAKGETDIGAIVNMSEEDIKNNGKKMQHIYTINNNGLTNWRDLPVYVTVEKQPYLKYDEITIFYSATNTYTECISLLVNETSETYLCKVESLMTSREYAKVLIAIYILPGTLDGLLTEDKNVTITSSVKLQPTDVHYSTAGVITTVAFQDAPVPLETIIIAVIVGLCILIIIALVLYRIGFLRRKRREELQKLRKSVKRQTILRRSTMPTQGRSTASGPVEDRKQILEGMKEEDEHDQAPSLI